MAGGDGSVILAEAFNEIKEAMSALVTISQIQAERLISIQRKADANELKAERVLVDMDGEKAGVHTQMEVLEEALYGLDGCDGLVDHCVKGEGAENPFAPMSESSTPREVESGAHCFGQATSSHGDSGRGAYDAKWLACMRDLE